MNEVRLYGHLRKFGRSFNYDVQTPAEAISALKATIPGFAEYLLKNSEPGYRIVVGKEVMPSMNHLTMRTSKVIKIVPVVQGAKSGGLSIVLGIALVLVAPEFSAVTLMGSVTVGSIATSLGVSLILGGITSMLTHAPTPSDSTRPTNVPSYVFNGAVNVTNQGNPVPLCYGGPMIVGSQLISGGLSAEQVAS